MKELTLKELDVGAWDLIDKLAYRMAKMIKEEFGIEGTLEETKREQILLAAEEIKVGRNWRPEIMFPGLNGVNPGCYESISRVRYLEFHWNIRELVKELNGDWRWDLNSDAHWIYYSFTVETFLFCYGTHCERIGPFMDKERAKEAQEILNAASDTWANPEHWMI